jgi:hypothetical protein
MKFESNPNIIKVADGIFWYKNFLSKEEVEKINEVVMNKKVKPHYFEEIHFETTEHMEELFPIWEKMSEFIYPDLVMHPLLNMIYYAEDVGMEPHCDSPGEDMNESLTVPDVWGTCCLLTYAAITYFGDFTGGEVYYPNQDITVPVQPGDLIIHGALKEHMHGVQGVKSGHRYAFSNFALAPEKNPGSFYNYGTEEYKEYSKNLSQWHTPLQRNEKSLDMKQKDGRYIK